MLTDELVKCLSQVSRYSGTNKIYGKNIYGPKCRKYTFTFVIIATLTDCRLMRFNIIWLEIESDNSEVIEI